MQLSHVIFNTAFFSLKLSKPELVLILLYGQLTYAEIKEETLCICQKTWQTSAFRNAKIMNFLSVWDNE